MDARSRVSSSSGMAVRPPAQAGADASAPPAQRVRAASLQRLRSRSENATPSLGEADSLVRLFCTARLPDAADRTLEQTLIRYSAPAEDRKHRRIDSRSLVAIVKPLAGNFDRMAASSDHGPYAFAHAMRLTARTLGAHHLEPATGELLMHQIPSSCQLSLAAQVQLPGALVHGVAAGIGWDVSAAARPSPLLLNRLHNPANWYQSPDWIASLFRGGVRALAPDTAGGIARVQALFDHLCDALPSLPPHAIAPVVQGFLDASVKHRFDTERWGRILLAHPACTQDPLRLGAVALGVARHYGSPTHAQWPAFDALARRAAAEERPEAAFVLGCALGWAARSAPALLAEVREGCGGRPPRQAGAAFARAGVDAAGRTRGHAADGLPEALQARMWLLAQGVATVAGHPPAAGPLDALAKDLPAGRADAVQRLLAVLPVPALCDWLPVARQLGTREGAEGAAGAIPAYAALERACNDLRAAARAQHPHSGLSLRPFAERLRALAASELHGLSQPPTLIGQAALRARVSSCLAVCHEVLGEPASAPPVGRVAGARSESGPSSPADSPAASPPGSPARDGKAAAGGSPGLWDRFTRWLAG